MSTPPPLCEALVAVTDRRQTANDGHGDALFESQRLQRRERFGEIRFRHLSALDRGHGPLQIGKCFYSVEDGDGHGYLREGATVHCNR
jgi:hypothetical protein